MEAGREVESKRPVRFLPPGEAPASPASPVRSVRAPGAMSLFMRTVVERESNMKVLVFATVVLGLTVFFGSFEPTFASSAPVTSDSVSVASVLADEARRCGSQTYGPFRASLATHLA